MAAVVPAVDEGAEFGVERLDRAELPSERTLDPARAGFRLTVMPSCDVLRCEAEGAHLFAPGASPAARVEIMLCHEHFEAAEGGERWVVDMATGRPSVLMGMDLPPSFTRWQAVEGHLSSAGDSLLMRLELQHADGTMSDIDFEMTAEQARGLEEILHVRWVEPPPDEDS